MILFQITHKKGYEEGVKYYVKLLKDDPEMRKHPDQAILKTAQIFKGVEPRGLASYINDLVKKGKLPKELKSQYEEMTFSKFVNKMNEANLVKEGDKPRLLELISKWKQMEEEVELNNPTQNKKSVTDLMKE